MNNDCIHNFNPEGCFLASLAVSGHKNSFLGGTNSFFGRLQQKWYQNVQEVTLFQISWFPKESKTSTFFTPCNLTLYVKELIFCNSRHKNFCTYLKVVAAFTKLIWPQNHKIIYKILWKYEISHISCPLNQIFTTLIEFLGLNYSYNRPRIEIIVYVIKIMWNIWCERQLF